MAPNVDAAKSPTIAIAGDHIVDWTFLKRESTTISMQPRPGGVLLLQALLADTDLSIKYGIKDLNKFLRESSPTEGHRALFETRSYPKSDGWAPSKDKTIRAERFMGLLEGKRVHAGVQPPPADAKALEAADEAADKATDIAADIVVLFDAALTFRTEQTAWPPEVQPGSSSLIVLRTRYPFEKNKLLDHLLEHHAERLIVVIDADSLRKADISIPRGLSWESTVSNFLGKIRASSAETLLKCRHLLVRFELDAVLHHDSSKDNAANLLYSPEFIESEIAEKFDGFFVGYGIAFTAALAIGIAKASEAARTRGDLDDDILKNAIWAPRRLLFRGYEGDRPCDYSTAFREMLSESQSIERITIERPQIDELDNGEWSFLKLAVGSKDDRNKILKLAKEIVVTGRAGTSFPIAHYGKLKSTERAEIESIRTIKKAIGEFLERQHVDRPLSLAAFGAPGTGKSFAIKEIASQFSGKKIDPITFNVSQFVSIDDLLLSFRQIQETTLKGKLALAFFDEFDCRMGTDPLGWLKYFLAPMQDGSFEEGGRKHGLGKAILVFAGGVFETFEKFRDEATKENIKDSKATDFISRLRGHINIQGINQLDDKANHGYMLKRALLMRSILETSYPGLLHGEEKKADIDEKVLTWLLSDAVFYHGVRSIEAFFDMSSLSDDRTKFSQSSLPPIDQQKMHVHKPFP